MFDETIESYKSHNYCNCTLTVDLFLLCRRHGLQRRSDRLHGNVSRVERWQGAYSVHFKRQTDHSG